MTHTILLVQTGEAETRVYSDFESVNECMEGICRIFEEHLRRASASSVTYDVSQLFSFIDNLGDINVLVFQASQGTYVPYDKEWIKEKTYVLLRKQVGVDA